MSATTGLDLDALKRAIESSDAAAQIALYAPDAEVITVDSQNPPSSPRRLAGIDEIRTMIEDVCARDMTHELTRVVADGEHVAYTEACRYADGTRVLCTAVLDVRDGKIVRQEGVQAWDEA
ncbi:MAG: nuclear transport factor 2 family protein [Conexibacter sp.]